MNRNKRNIAVLAFVALMVLMTALSSCQTAPTYSVESMDELKDALKDYDDILIFDLSQYKMDADYHVSQWVVNRKILNGYWISSLTPPMPTVCVGNVEFLQFEIGCLSLDRYQDERNPPPPFDLNAEYFGVKAQDWSGDFTNDQEQIEIYEVPKNTYIYWYRLDFDFNGGRYSIHARMQYPMSTDGDDSAYLAKVEEGKDALLKLMKSIIDQAPDAVASEDEGPISDDDVYADSASENEQEEQVA